MKDGRLVLDEPSDLPEGTEVELVPADDIDDLDGEERARLHGFLAASIRGHEPGSGVASDEVGVAAAWWRANRKAAPELFDEELAYAIGLLARMPVAAKVWRQIEGKDVRKARLPRTRYMVFFTGLPRSCRSRCPGIPRFTKGSTRGSRTLDHGA